LIDKYGAVPTVNGTLMASENGTAVLANGGFDLIEDPEIWKARQKVEAALKYEIPLGSTVVSTIRYSPALTSWSFITGQQRIRQANLPVLGQLTSR